LIDRISVCSKLGYNQLDRREWMGEGAGGILSILGIQIYM